MEKVWAALVMDRRRRQVRPDQLDAAAVDDLVAAGCRDGDSPTEVVGDAEAHGADYACAVRVGLVGIEPTTQGL